MWPKINQHEILFVHVAYKNECILALQRPNLLETIHVELDDGKISLLLWHTNFPV